MVSSIVTTFISFSLSWKSLFDWKLKFTILGQYNDDYYDAVDEVYVTETIFTKPGDK